jgi:GAF domain-containing protein
MQTASGAMFRNDQTAPDTREQHASVAPVSIVGSAGSVTAMREILAQLPADFPAPILYLAADPVFVAHRDIARKAGVYAVQSIPLITRRGACIGVLSTHFRKPRMFSQEEIHMLERHAGYAADMIERLLIA